MPEVSRLMHTNSVQVVDFDMCRFGHPDKGPMRMLTNSLQVARKAHRKGARRKRHAAKETDVKI